MTVATSTQTAVVTGDGLQFIRIGPGGGYVELDLDPDFTDTIQEAYMRVLVYVPSSIQAGIIAAGGLTNGFIQSDGFQIYIEKIGSDYYWSSGDTLSLVQFDQWVEIEWLATVEAESDVWIDGVHFVVDSGTPSGINYVGVGYALNGADPDNAIDVDELSYAFLGRVSDSGPYAMWAFETVDPIGDAIANWPDPPFTINEFQAGFLSIEAGGGEEPEDIFPGFGPIPVLPPTVKAFLDSTEVTSCVQSGSVTRRLNRPATATLRMFTDCAPGTACSRVKIEIDSNLWFHGFVTQISTEAGEDGNLMSEYTCQDPMMLWQWRPARDGVSSGDLGDFSNPKFFELAGGPAIMEEIITQSEDDSDPQFGEGPLFVEYDGGSFPGGIVDLSAAPTDFPMTIAEVFELLSSTGTLDGVLTPIDSGGNMARLDFYNGDYGTDRTGSVAFEYETGNHNVRSLRMTEDSTNLVNKLWYYLGPRKKTAKDPAGDQHWAGNVTGQNPAFDPAGDADAVPPGGRSVDDTNTPVGPPWTDNQLGERIYNSRISDCGVRMEVRVYDSQGDDALDPFEAKQLYWRLWQMESWLRAIPRVLVHITPVRTSVGMQLPPGVTPVSVGDFDIGDLVTVTAGTVVRGGFTGAQRIYEYTVTWDEDGILELGELLTTSDQEGVVDTL